jgi:hypothetical protein
MSKLLTRDEFRRAVFARDNNLCVVCKEPADAAHHIIERRLFVDGGYYLDNGASLCPACHIRAEETTLSVEDVRSAAEIRNKVIPPHLYDDTEYTKWGDVILSNGDRLRGELFDDASVQKILAQGKVLNLYRHYVKYPRTNHFHFSPGMNSDDRALPDESCFEGKDVVVTEKLDGESCTQYSDHIHARSVESKNHLSRNAVKVIHGAIAHDIPNGWRICGENLWAKHSIYYDNLKSYFMVFSIWNEKNICLSWKETLEWCELLGLTPVPVLYEGKFDINELKKIEKSLDLTKSESYVCRDSGSFHFSKFPVSVAKFVRAGHVQTSQHWINQKLTPNLLADRNIKVG